MISGTSSKTRVYSSGLRYLHLLYETFYFSWKKSREKIIIIILEYMEYGLGKTPHSVTLTKWRFFFWIPDPKNVTILVVTVTGVGWGGVEPKEYGGFCQFFASFFRNADTSHSMFHPLEYGSYGYMDKPPHHSALVNPGEISITTSLMVSTHLKNIISQIGMKINIWNYHLDKRYTHGLSLSLTPRLGFTSKKRACFRLSTKIWSRCHSRRLSCL